MATKIPRQRPSELRLATIILLVPLYVSLAFAVNYFGALHAPTPHSVKVGVAGSSVASSQAAAELATRPPNGFDVTRLRSAAEARSMVASRRLAGAYVPDRDGAIAIVATAASPSLAQVLEATFAHLPAGHGRMVAVDDVRPLPAADATGTPNFFFLVICTLAGFITAIALGLATPALPEPQRLLVLVAAAVLAPAGAYLVGGVIYGTFPGDVGTILAMVGMGALYTLAVAGTTRLLQLAFGPAGPLPASLVVIFLNLPTSGGTVAPQLMPGFWRFLNHFWIGADAMNANRSILYFGGAGVGDDVLKVLAWIAGWGVLLAFPIYRRRSQHRRENTGAVSMVSGSPALPAAVNN